MNSFVHSMNALAGTEHSLKEATVRIISQVRDGEIGRAVSPGCIGA